MPMATITNFDEWLDEACDGSPADVYALHEAVNGETDFAQYHCTPTANGQWIVSCHGAENQLRLVTTTARETFPCCLHGRYVEGGMPVGTWYAMHHALDKDD